jgi:hypothetical protein
MTPLHIAAKEGWGDNLDVFFKHSHGDMNRLQTQCLTIRDHSECTVLDYSRMAGDRDVIQGREDVIAAEMTKHAIPVPPKILNTVPVHDNYMSIPLGRPRLPTPEPAANSPYGPPPTSEHRPANTPSPQPHAPRFPPPIVYRDPSIETNQNLNTPFPRPTFPVSQVYQDPNFPPYVPRAISPTLAPTRPQFSPAQISHDQQPRPPGPPVNYRQPAQALYSPQPSSFNIASPQDKNQNFHPPPGLSPTSASPTLVQGTPSVRSTNSQRAPSFLGETIGTEDSARPKESKGSRFLEKFKRKG